MKFVKPTRCEHVQHEWFSQNFYRERSKEISLEKYDYSDLQGQCAIYYKAEVVSCFHCWLIVCGF